jgi:hypothetical protein
MIPQVTLLEDIADWRTKSNILGDSVDDIALLETTNKSSLVHAINELKDTYFASIPSLRATITNGEILNGDCTVVSNVTNFMMAKVPCDLDDLISHGNAGTALTLDCCAHDTHVFTCDQSTLTLSLSNFDVGRTIKLIVVGGSTCTITYPVGTKFIDGIPPVLSVNTTVLVAQKLINSIHVFIQGTDLS